VTPRYRLEHVVRRYRPLRSAREVEALRVPSLEVGAGEILAVVGPNGSGKSTLLETMGFLGRPDEGRILLDGRDVWAEGESLGARRRCPMLLQRTVLFKTSVLGNVMYGLRARGMSRAESRRRAEQVLRQVRLDDLARRTHRELSGGERQRVAMARLLALEPDVLLLDEPTAHVDHANARLIEAIIRDLHATTGMTVVLASHDRRQARALADRVVTLLDGQLFSGTVDNLLAGTLRPEDGGFTFQGEGDLRLHFAAEAIVGKDREQSPAAHEAPVQIALDAERLVVVPLQTGTDCPLGGKIASIDREEDRYRVAVRLDAGLTISASVSPADYARLGLNLDRAVCLQLADGAVRVIPARS